MINDPIVAEVRRIREEYARRFNFDIDAMLADLKARQEQSGAESVVLPPRCTERRSPGGQESTATTGRATK